MRVGSPILGVTFMGVFLAGAALVGTAWAQPGTPLSHQKINDNSLVSSGLALEDLDEFGDSVANLGDLDGPGPSTVAIAVGTVGDDDGGLNRGAVYILFLDAGANVLSGQKISDTAGNFTAAFSNEDEFGGSVTSLGDLDGAGPSVAALAVGTVGDDDGGLDCGAVYILFLNPNGTVRSHQKISDTQGNFAPVLFDLDEFGGAVCGLGDLDGPGPSAGAIAIGAIGDDDGGSRRGAFYICYLATNGTVLSTVKISDTQGNFTAILENGDDFGEDITNLGDLDGPGPSDLALAVSAVRDNDGGTDRGAVYILFMTNAGAVLSHQTISNTSGGFTAPLQDLDNFGSSVLGLGDLDGPDPSVATLAVGATGHDGLGFDRGIIYLLFLNAAGTVLSYSEIGENAGNFVGKLDDTDEFGAALAVLGDLDGNGPAVQTLLSGTSFDDDGGMDRGAVWVLYLAGHPLLGVGDPAPGARVNALGRVRPNPFKPATAIPFRISEAGRVRIDIMDVRGRLVRRLVQDERAAGEHQVTWNGLDDSGRRLAPGTYFLRMSVNGRIVTTGAKAVLLR